jgi:hypothetical protein
MKTDVDFRMLIPLRSDLFVMTSLTFPEKNWRITKQDESAVCQYRLVDRLIPIVEGDQVPGKLNRKYTIEYIPEKGVCICCSDHSFGRGLVRLIYGWTLLFSVQNKDGDAVETMLRKRASGAYIRSESVGFDCAIFNLESEDDFDLVVEIKMGFQGVSVVRSKLEGGCTREDAMIEDNPELTTIGLPHVRARFWSKAEEA